MNKKIATIEHSISVLKHKISEHKGWIKFYRKNLKKKSIPFCHSKKEVINKKRQYRKDIIKSLADIADLKRAIKVLTPPQKQKP